VTRPVTHMPTIPTLGERPATRCRNLRLSAFGSRPIGREAAFSRNRLADTGRLLRKRP